jgi:hypothetical protein|tara:strand:+ start:108 stop:485 length:378 start_codon:yes stop_codon:yes gene_type:complete
VLIKKFVTVVVLGLLLNGCSTGYNTEAQMWNAYKDKNLRFKHAIWAEIYNWEERGFEFGKIAFHTDISLESAIQKVFNDVQCTRGCTILYINNKLIDEKKQKEILTKYSSPEIVERFFPKKPKRN